MKTLQQPGFFAFFLVAIGSMMAVGCKPNLEGELGSPFDKIEGIDGTWKLSRVIQTDEKAPDKRQLDLSSHYLGEGGATISFDKDNQSFTADFSSGKNFFGTTGDFRLNNSQFEEYNSLYPDHLYLMGAADTNILKLGQPVRAFDTKLFLRLERKCIDDAGAEQVRSSYEFEFDRQ